MSTEKTVAFLVARLTSSRLPNKHFRTIGDRPLIAWTLGQLQASRQVDQVVITTVDEPENRPLRDFARERDVDCYWYRGEVDHVTHRLRTAAEHYEADICILISGDCPLVYAPLLDLMVQQLRQHPAADVLVRDAAMNTATEGIMVARRRAWQRADDLSDRPELREHQFPVIGQRPELFSFHRAELPAEYALPHHRFSVDTPADLDFMRRLFSELERRGKGFDLPGVIEMLSKQPELRQINAHVHQRRLVEDVKRVLMVVDAGPEYGYGHLMRSRELGRYMLEALSWPVLFVVDDEYAYRSLQEDGQQVQWGAFERAYRSPVAGAKVAPADWSAFDWVFLDIYPRPVAPGWRNRLFSRDSRIVASDTSEGCAAEADLVLFPGLVAPTAAQIERLQGTAYLAGADCLILRKEVVDALPMTERKDIDLLAYLRNPDEIAEVRQLAERFGWHCVFVDGQHPRFASLMARSRFFLGNFGQSFYEAIFLRAWPLSLPLSQRHHAEAKGFYRALGVTDGTLENLQHLPVLMQRFPDATAQLGVFPSLQNGIKHIVDQARMLSCSP